MIATQTTTVSDLARSVMPGWSFPADWLCWPPNCFAFTAMVMRQTGCYRHVISRERPHPARWQIQVEDAAAGWLRRVHSLLAGEGEVGADALEYLVPPGEGLFAEAVRDLARLASEVEVDELRVLATPRARELAAALIKLHAIADEACSGMGLLASANAENALAHYVANLLLTSYGSLSALPKHQGVVLPKMRTPQSGLTLRSMSHHVTFHTSEVEVMWRSVPWANIEENTINILCIPWPAEVREQCFRTMRETFEAVRYFKYDPVAPPDEERIDAVVELVRRVNEQVGRLHMIVFPELALSREEYEMLMWKLWVARQQEEGRISHVPIVITGALNRDKQEGDLNEVRLATYFAGRWYELSQRKHHRWKLNRSQILQYALEGRLATARHWYEDIPVVQRRLTFLAPTGWLALCPLICEDLAQLEPVSDLIRGVGPTLLIALLMDGPQMKERWSARYASVFADDPGTAVLSLTSVGMAERSRAENQRDAPHKPARTVALWKDQITGWKPVDLQPKRDAVLLTISADWTEEFTADNRSDHKNAAVFKFEGLRQFAFRPPGAASPAAVPLRAETQENKEQWLGTWADIRELSAATYALDAMIALHGRHRDRIGDWLLGTSAPPEHLPAPLAELLARARAAQAQPRSVGIFAQETAWPTDSLVTAAAVVRTWFDGREDEPQPELESTYWRKLAREAIDMLRDAENVPGLECAEWNLRRIRRAVPIAVLAAMHSRLERRRKRRSPRHGGDTSRDPRPPEVDWDELSGLLEEVEEALKEHL